MPTLRRGMLDAAIGAIAGLLCGTVAFFTLAVLLFAFGVYSRAHLTEGSVGGALLGLISGAVIGKARPRALHASLALGSLLTILYLAYVVPRFLLAPVSPDPEFAIRFCAYGAGYWGVGGALVGAVTAALLAHRVKPTVRLQQRA